jgi:hypothetical protein
MARITTKKRRPEQVAAKPVKKAKKREGNE